MNKVILSGNLCKDIEVKQTQSGKGVISNTIAVQREFKNGNGEYESDFINIQVWGASVEYLNKYAKKGDRVELVGRWQVRSYDGTNGYKQYVNECIVESIKVFSKPNEETKDRTMPNLVEVEGDLPF